MSKLTFKQQVAIMKEELMAQLAAINRLRRRVARLERDKRDKYSFGGPTYRG